MTIKLIAVIGVVEIASTIQRCVTFVISRDTWIECVGRSPMGETNLHYVENCDFDSDEHEHSEQVLYQFGVFSVSDTYSGSSLGHIIVQPQVPGSCTPLEVDIGSVV